VSEDCVRGPATEERVSRELFERAKMTLWARTACGAPRRRSGCPASCSSERRWRC